MEDLQTIVAASPLLARAQKIRQRMAIEVMLGIPATNRELFIPLCRQYEEENAQDFPAGFSALQYEGLQQHDASEYRWTEFNDFLGHQR